jgi:hypothetical protein
MLHHCFADVTRSDTPAAIAGFALCDQMLPRLVLSFNGPD